MFSRLSLRYRIALVIFLLEACMLGAVLAVSLQQSHRIAADFNADSQKASLDLLSNLSVTALLTSEYTDYQLYIDDVKKQPSIERIVLVDSDQRVVASTHVIDVGHKMSDVIQASHPGWQVSTVNTAAGPLGTLAVQFSDAALSKSYKHTRNLAIGIAISGMTIIALVGLATGFALTRRLGRVTDAARLLAAGNIKARSNVSGSDEVALLSRSVDSMAEAVALQQHKLQEQREYIELLLNSTAEAIYGVDTNGICTFVNPTCLHMLGYQHESDLVGKPIHELIHHTYPDGTPYPKEKCAVRLSVLQGQTCHNDVEVHWRADGSSFPVEYWSHPMYKDGNLIGAVVTFVDISERKQSELELLRFRAALDSSVDAIYLIDVQKMKFVDANRAGWESVGYTRAELLQLGPLDLAADYTRMAMTHEIETLLKTPADSAVIETVHHRKDGSNFPVEISLQSLSTHSGSHDSAQLLVALARDITEHKQNEEELNRLAYYDMLTGLPNRLLFNDRLHRAALDAKRRGHYVALLLLDIDRFKVVNDTMGHVAGDQLLREMASRLKSSVREGDTISRLGGDEFALVFADINEVRDVAQLAQNILTRLSIPMEIDGREVFSSASIGITLYPSDTEEVDTMVKFADSAMYYAKEQGRNNYQFYSQEMTTTAQERLRVESNLRRALEREELFLHYQPQVEIASGRIRGVEALLRWHDSHGRHILPGQFIPLAEETGLIVPIGEWVLHQACQQLKRWHNAGYSDMTMSVNVASRQFKDPRFAQLVLRSLESLNIPANCLELEITESVLMENSELILRILNELKHAGVNLAIDDFGTGYSSLSYLKRFPIDRVKIDRSFIRDLSSDSDDVAIVKAIIAMSKTLRLRVVAEGVETEEQLALLRGEGCHGFQGFLFATPMPENELSDLLHRHAPAIKKSI
ncbi:MAG: EAL domain-containing protein [Gammaproteobacteria bacterium]|nr:EAL domain-containing protein [Gammaproteobacteria bacterium]